MNSEIKILNLSIGYQYQSEKKILVSGIETSLTTGKLIALLGRNGIGKSTLLKTIAGSILPIKGRILIDNQFISEISFKDLAKKISIGLTGRIQATHLTVWELLSISRAPYTDWLGRLSEIDKQVINKSIELTHIQSLVNHTLSTLSDGEHQKTMIARAFVQNTPFMLLDEPTAHLDISNKLSVFQLLQKLAHRENKGILVSTHEIHFALQYSDEIWLMDEGSFYRGIPTDIHLLQKLEKAFGVQGLMEMMES
ncbi:MAG: hypothetical protein OHK0038_14280 [Flammeovirgaceae bacterium]